MNHKLSRPNKSRHVIKKSVGEKKTMLWNKATVSRISNVWGQRWHEMVKNVAGTDQDRGWEREIDLYTEKIDHWVVLWKKLLVKSLILRCIFLRSINNFYFYLGLSLNTFLYFAECLTSLVRCEKLQWHWEESLREKIPFLRADQSRFFLQLRKKTVSELYQQCNLSIPQALRPYSKIPITWIWLA